MSMIDIDLKREEIEVLLPWHATGTLGRRDAERVEKALAGDRELGRRFDLARENISETVRFNETLGAPSAQAISTLLAAIDAEPARKASVSFDLAGRLARFISGFSPRALAWAGSAAVLALVLQASVIGTTLVKSHAGQGTELASVGVTDASVAMVRFAPKADAAAITAFLDANKASVIAGPQAGGLYTVRLPATGRAKDDLIRQMQVQADIVGFIAPVQ